VQDKLLHRPPFIGQLLLNRTHKYPQLFHLNGLNLS